MSEDTDDSDDGYDSSASNENPSFLTKVKKASVDSTPKKIISRSDDKLDGDLKDALGRFSDAGEALWLSQTQHEESICLETATLADFARRSPDQISFRDIYMLAVSDWLKYSQKVHLDLYEWAKVITGRRVYIDDYSTFFPQSFKSFLEVVCLTVRIIYHPANINV